MPSFIVTAEEDFIPNGGDDQISWWDYESVVSIAITSVVEEYAVSDPSTVIGQAVVSAIAQNTYVDEVSTVTSVSVIETSLSGQAIVDSNVVTSVAGLAAEDVASYLDAPTAMISRADPAALENFAAQEAAVAVIGVCIPSAIDRPQFLDRSPAISLCIATGLETMTFSEIGLSQGQGVPTAPDVAAFLDQVTIVTANGGSLAQESFNTGNFYTDINACISISVPTAIDGKTFPDSGIITSIASSTTTENFILSDAGTVTEFQAISAVDVHTFLGETSTVTSVFAPIESQFGGQDTFTRSVADTASGTFGVSDGGYSWAIDPANTMDVVGVNGTQGHVRLTGGSRSVEQVLQVPASNDWDITGQFQWDVAAAGNDQRVFLYARYQFSTLSWYGARLTMNPDGSIETSHTTNINEATTVVTSPIVVQAAGGWTPGQVWNIRFQLIGTHLKSKVWTGGVEPGSWTTSTTSSDIIGSGTLGTGFFTAVGHTGTVNFLVDNLTFTNLAAVITPDLFGAVDSSPARAIAQPSATFTTPYIDAATVAAHAVPSATDTYTSGYAFFDSFVRNPVSNGWGTPSDSTNPWVVVNGQASDFSTTGTVGKIFVSDTASHEIAVAVPAPGAGKSKYNIGQFMQWQWNTTNNGTQPIQIGAHLYWVDEVNRTYYRLVVGQKPSTGSLQLSLDKVLTSGNTDGLGGFNIITSTSSLNTYYNLRTEASGLNTLRPTFNARLWLASASEPTAWGFTYTDTSGSYPPLNANYGFRTNIFAGDTNNPTLKFAQYYGYYL